MYIPAKLRVALHHFEYASKHFLKIKEEALERGGSLIEGQFVSRIDLLLDANEKLMQELRGLIASRDVEGKDWSRRRKLAK